MEESIQKKVQSFGFLLEMDKSVNTVMEAHAY